MSHELKARSGTSLTSSQIVWRSISELRCSSRNARTHSKKQIAQIAKSISDFGFLNPIVIGPDRRIIVGHARYKAARLLGLTMAPTISVTHLSEAAIRAYALADNRLAEKAGWDRELLAIELNELQELLPKEELTLDDTGFDSAEIDRLLLDIDNDKPDPVDDVPQLHARATARLGDSFLLGRNRLFVGDARRLQSFEALMQGERAGMAILDPPYNVRILGHVGGRGRIKHREFVCGSGEMSAREFEGFLHETLALCAKFSKDGSIHYVFMDWRHVNELLQAGAKAYGQLKNVCVWVKSNAGQGAFYRSQHELVFVFKHGDAPHINTFELGQHGRNRSNVWHYAGVNSFRAGRLDELKIHPTVKPVTLVADAIQDCSRRGDIVLDAFAGSGTTIMAAERLGRRAYCLELDPIYADVAIRRWQAYTGRDAVLAETGETFDELSATRAAADLAAVADTILKDGAKPASRRRRA